MPTITEFNILVAFLWVVIFDIRIKWIWSNLCTSFFLQCVCTVYQIHVFYSADFPLMSTWHHPTPSHTSSGVPPRGAITGPWSNYILTCCVQVYKEVQSLSLSLYFWVFCLFWVLFFFISDMLSILASLDSFNSFYAI